MTDDEDDFVQQALREDIEKECRVLGETPKPQNVLRVAPMFQVRPRGPGLG